MFAHFLFLILQFKCVDIPAVWLPAWDLTRAVEYWVHAEYTHLLKLEVTTKE